MENEKKILIIDDDPRNIFALSAVLKAKGFSVVTSTSAQTGLRLLRSDKDITVVLMDMMMPDMDGYEAISLIRGDRTLAELAVVAVTAQAMEKDREKCLEAGADDYVSKPVDVDRLLVLLNQYKERTR